MKFVWRRPLRASGSRVLARISSLLKFTMLVWHACRQRLQIPLSPPFPEGETDTQCVHSDLA